MPAVWGAFTHINGIFTSYRPGREHYGVEGRALHSLPGFESASTRYVTLTSPRLYFLLCKLVTPVLTPRGE